MEEVITIFVKWTQKTFLFLQLHTDQRHTVSRQRHDGKHGYRMARLNRPIRTNNVGRLVDEMFETMKSGPMSSNIMMFLKTDLI